MYKVQTCGPPSLKRLFTRGSLFSHITDCTTYYECNTVVYLGSFSTN
jgi:hypothetical protein